MLKLILTYSREERADHLMMELSGLYGGEAPALDLDQVLVVVLVVVVVQVVLVLLYGLPKTQC
jgi:phage shock protein PspC (stress-responsive transcriptional regulator)